MADDEHMPMTAQWAMVDEMVDKYAEVLRRQPHTTSDIAVDLLGSQQFSDKRFLAMLSATLLQRLAVPR